MDYDPFSCIYPSVDNMDILGDMHYKFLVHDCMWSGACKEDNIHETTNKLSDFSYFSSSPSYGSIFDIFNIDDENSLGELSGDNDYDTSDHDNLPINGLSSDSVVDDSDNTLTSTTSSSTLINSSIITPTTSQSAASTSNSISLSPSSSTSTSSKSSTSKLASTTSKSTATSKASRAANSKASSSTIAKSTLSTGKPSTSVKNETLIIPTTSTTAVVDFPVATISGTSTVNITSTNNSTITSTPSITANASNNSTSILKSTGKPRNPKSLYPERRKEHNNSEKKRRDHLRNAFNHLRDQIPKLKDGEKKAARVTILKEAVSYVTLLKEKHRYLERTKNAETLKNENLLKRLKMLQSSAGASFNNDSNVVYVQCNTTTPTTIC